MVAASPVSLLFLDGRGGREAAGAGEDGGRYGSNPADIEEKKGGVVLQST